MECFPLTEGSCGIMQNIFLSSQNNNNNKKKKLLTIYLSQFMLRWWEQNRQSHIPTQETQPLELYGAQPFRDAGLNFGITGAIDSHMSCRPWKKHSYTGKVSENMLTDTVC